ncbi:v-type proton ATPase 16 kDa proteolipid subunit 2, variant 2 [Entomophthora muscae]|uniref:V-type proton ATPase 16 kDa proteolipid subunit 2, variant 2 n=1 Tax=Entomophthora muscae TaxID=34485 RepID=A0ACC2RVZ1_9FUNG|nr:v-type proton ATPase 16 kDa proteolipid subunit 2, variant 2 [Entomophthora muscae]
MSQLPICPAYAPFFGFAGVASAMILSSLGAAYGTAKSGVGIAGVGTLKPEIIMKSLIPVVMAGIIAIYGLVTSVLIAGAMGPKVAYSLFAGLVHLAAGVTVGFTGLAAGYSIGIVGDAVSCFISSLPPVFLLKYFLVCSRLFQTTQALCFHGTYLNFC